MTKKLFPFFLLIVAFGSIAAGPQLLDGRWERAYQAWDSGDYITALREFDAFLKEPDADRWFERIALITGELYQVQEVAPDGRSPRFSSSGRYVAFETGTAPSGITHIVDVENQFQKVADVQGESLSFSPTSQTAVYLCLKDSPEIAVLRKEVEDLSKASPQDQQALTAKRRQLSMLESKNSEIVLRDLVSGKERRLEDPGLLKAAVAFSADGSEIYLVGARDSDTASCDIYALSESGKPRVLTSGAGYKTGLIVVPARKYLVYLITNQSPFQRGGGGRQGGPGGGQGTPPAAGGGTLPARGQAAAAGAPGGRGGGGQGQRSEFAVFDLAAGTAANFNGSAPAIAANGSALVYLADNNSTIQFMKFAAPLTPAAAKKSSERIGSAALSPDGSRITFEMPYTRNTEIFCIKSDGTEEVRA